MSRLRLAFVGPSKGVKAIVVLESILDSKYIPHEQICVITDGKPGWPLVELCDTRGIAYHRVQDLSLLTDSDFIDSLHPTHLVSCGWGAKIATGVLGIPSVAALNCHSSLLPDYRGLGVYNHYWANCEEWIGATVHFMTRKFDAGNIVAQQMIRAYRWDTPATMLHRISEVTAPLLREALLLTAQGYTGYPQSGGRYFLQSASWKFKLYRIYNLWASRLGIPRRLTPHKVQG